MEPRSEWLNKENFAWMIGASVASIEGDSAGADYWYWFVNFSNGGFVTMQPGTWRLSLRAESLFPRQTTVISSGFPLLLTPAQQGLQPWERRALLMRLSGPDQPI